MYLYIAVYVVMYVCVTLCLCGYICIGTLLSDKDGSIKDLRVFSRMSRIVMVCG